MNLYLWRIRQAFGALVLLSLGCSRDAPEGTIDSAPRPEPSPNAHLLPDPLPFATPSGIEAEGKFKDAGGAARPYPIDEILPRDDLSLLPLEADSAIYEFTVRIVEKRARPSTKASPESPWDMVWDAALFVPGGRKPERLRLTMRKGPWLFPLGSELRARADRLGHVLVWPDGRSYRVAPAGSLLSLLGERRADVMPRFAPTVEGPKDDGAAGTRLTLRTQVGQLVLEMRAATSAEPSGLLMCRALTELIRARGVEPCTLAFAVRGAELKLEGGPPVKFYISPLRRTSEVQLRAFLIPPDMPVFKPGEYPPGRLGPLSEDQEAATLRNLGIQLKPDRSLANVAITNGLGLPVLLSIDDHPVRYLGTQETLWLSSSRVFSYETDAVFGLIRSGQGRIEPSTEVLLGGTPEAYPWGKPRTEE